MDAQRTSAKLSDSPLAIVIGDSLTREYDDPGVNIQGWGYELPKYFGPGLRWRNDARGTGRSEVALIARMNLFSCSQERRPPNSSA